MLLIFESCKVPVTISSVIKSPAMPAVMKHTKHPHKKERKATLVISGLRSGAKALSAPIIIPNDDGLAKPQIA